MIKVISKSNNEITFLITGISETIANAIRRSVNEIPILAIDEVEFIKNDSTFYDEIIAHRLGLIPLKTEKNLVEKEKCSCKGKGCIKCTVSFKLSMKGPTTVFSSNLKGKADVVYEKMPIVLLTKDQEIEFSAYAVLGKGKQHVKFSPGLAYYRPMAEIKISKECNDCEACIKACPLKIIKKEKDKLIVDEESCNLCEACIEACRKEGKDCIKISHLKEQFIFTIESFGQIDMKYIFLRAIEAIDENLAELKKVVSKL